MLCDLLNIFIQLICTTAEFIANFLPQTIKFDTSGWHKPLFELATAKLNLIKKGPAMSLVFISLLSDTKGIFPYR